MFFSHFRSPKNRFHRNLQLQQDDIGSGNLLFGGIDIGRSKERIGTWSHYDAIFRRGIYGDKRHSGSNAFMHGNETGIDPLFCIMTHRIVPKTVISDRRDEGHISSQSGGCNGLIGPFPARIGQKIRAHNRFPRLRNPCSADRKIRI